MLTLSACNTMQIGSEDNYKKELQVYVGKDIANVVKDHGHADNLSQAPNGNRLFIYVNSETSTSPVNCQTTSKGKQHCTGGDVSESLCKTYFEVDQNNIVTSYSFKGNNCKSCESKDAVLCF